MIIISPELYMPYLGTTLTKRGVDDYFGEEWMSGWERGLSRYST